MNQCNCKNTDELRIVRGNAFGVQINIEARRLDGTLVEDFDLSQADATLKVIHYDQKTEKSFVVAGNSAIIGFDNTLPLGWYGFEMYGTFNDSPWRWCVLNVFQIVETNEKANIPTWTFLTDDTYVMDGSLTLMSGEVYQSDWDETNIYSPAYIKNKPDVVLHPEFNQTVERIDHDIDTEELARQQADTTLQGNIDAEETRAKAAEKQNADDIDALETRMGTAEDDIDAIESKIPAAASSSNKLVDKQQMDNATADFITKSVNDLVNYYLKSDTYTKTEVQQLIAAVKQFTYEVVQTLPTASASTMNKIYLVPSTNPKTENVKDEYITIATETEEGGETVTTYSWEQIGSTTVDLSGYYTSQQTDTAISNALTTALADYSTTSQMNTAITNALNTALADYSTTTEMTAAIATAIANYYTKSEVDALIANFITKSVTDLVNYYLKSDTYTKAEVQQLIAAVKQFTYEVVSTLPTASASTMNKIYLVPSTNPKTENVKDEYITIATETEEGGETVTTYSWEQIGSTTVDLSGYYTSAQTDTAISNAISTALADYSTTTQMNTAITNALNAALADYSTTTEMTAAIATAIANYYTKAEVDALIANFITKSVNDLVNYYLKSDTYTKAEVQQLIAAVKQFTYEVVNELPTASASTMNKIYLVPSTNPETKNVKDEYITISTETEEGGETVTTYSWEQIGSTTVDLSGYYTSAQTDTAISNALTTALADYSTTSEMNTAITNALNTALADYSTTTEMTAAIATAIANYYTKSEVDALIANFITKSVNDLVNYYLKSDTYTKAEVQQLIAAVKLFTYEVVSTLPTASASTMNKIYLVPSADPQTQNVKDEFITIATETEEGGETVTTYSWEQIGSTTVDLSGYYTSAQTDTAISNAISTALADYSTTTQMNTAITNALNTALADYSTTSQMNTAISTALASYYTKTEVDTALNGKQDTLTFDNTPTENSNNPVKSGGIYSALAGKQASITDGVQIGLGGGLCTTAAATPAKEVTISNFILLKYAPVSIRFQNGISINGSTLNISSTGAKPILIDGVALPAGVVKPNTTATMYYDGTNWNVTALTTGVSSDSELLVDLELPSGLLWATRNLDVTQANGFAASPYQYECSFFSWGNTDGHNPVSNNSFGEWSFGNANTSEPYVSSPGAALTASFGNGYDAACVNLGKPWRMPTTEEFAELFNASNTKFINADGTDIDASTANKLTTVNGVVGIMLKSLVNSKTLFFPCSGFGNGASWYYRGSRGYYWSSSLYSAALGRNLYFYSGGVSPQYYYNRVFGFTVRPVQ